MKSAEEQKGDPQVAAIRRAIDVRLKAWMRDGASAPAAAAHPDEDVINAYVEGWLEESKAGALISHLVSCASCLHMTAELIRFDPEMDEAASPTTEVEQSPLQRFFDRLASDVLPTIDEDSGPSIGEASVYAYNLQEKDKAATTEPEADENSPSETESR